MFSVWLLLYIAESAPCEPYVCRWFADYAKSVFIFDLDPQNKLID